MISNQGMYDEFMSVMGYSRSVWEKGEGSTLLTETRPRSRSPPEPAKQNAEIDQYVGKRLAKEFKGIIYFGNFVERIRGHVLAA